MVPANTGKELVEDRGPSLPFNPFLTFLSCGLAFA